MTSPFTGHLYRMSHHLYPYMCTCAQYTCLLALEFWECCKLPYIWWLFVVWASHCLSARTDCVRLYCSTSSTNMGEGTVACLYSATVPVPLDVGNFAVHSCVRVPWYCVRLHMCNHRNYISMQSILFPYTIYSAIPTSPLLFSRKFYNSNICICVLHIQPLWYTHNTYIYMHALYSAYYYTAHTKYNNNYCTAVLLYM